MFHANTLLLYFSNLFVDLCFTGAFLFTSTFTLAAQNLKGNIHFYFATFSHSVSKIMATESGSGLATVQLLLQRSTIHSYIFEGLLQPN